MPAEAPKGGFGPGLRAFAQQLWWERRWRTRFFPSEIFGEPAWDMMLDAYGRQPQDEGFRPAEVSKLHLSASATPDIARRSFKELTALAILEPAGTGRRATQVKLTAEATEGMSKLLSPVLLQRNLAVGQSDGAFDGGNPDCTVEVRLTLLAARMMELLDDLDRVELPEAAAHLSLAVSVVERHLSPGTRMHDPSS